MGRPDPNSPLPPDPADREDIMSDEPRGEAAPVAREGQPPAIGDDTFARQEAG